MIHEHIWSYGGVWCFYGVFYNLCIASLHHGEWTYIKTFQIQGIFMGFLWVFDILSDFGS